MKRNRHGTAQRRKKRCKCDGGGCTAALGHVQADAHGTATEQIVVAGASEVALAVGDSLAQVRDELAAPTFSGVELTWCFFRSGGWEKREQLWRKQTNKQTNTIGDK